MPESPINGQITITWSDSESEALIKLAKTATAENRINRAMAAAKIFPGLPNEIAERTLREMVTHLQAIGTPVVIGAKGLKYTESPEELEVEADFFHKMAESTERKALALHRLAEKYQAKLPLKQKEIV